MQKQKKMTAQNTSVGADDEQSQYTTKTITHPRADYKKNFRETKNSDCLYTVTLTQLLKGEY